MRTLGFAAQAPGAGAARRLLCALALSFIALVSLSTHAWSQSVSIARITSGSNDPFDAICQLQECTYTDVSETQFNALSVAQLFAGYDLLFFGFDLGTNLDANWQTRLRPYVEAGGGVIFESAFNLPDLAGLVSGSLDNDVPPFVVANVPGLTDGISSDLVNSHMRFHAWAPELSPFITAQDGAVVGLYGSVGDGRIVITGPDNGFHGVPGASPGEANMFALLANEVAWTTALAGDAPTVHWTKGASGSWQETASWTPAVSPGAVHDVRIDPAVSVTVTGPATDTAVNTLEIGGGEGFATLSLLGGKLTSLADRVKVLAKGILTGDGTVAGGVLNEGRIVAQNLTIQGGVENRGVITGNGLLNADISNTSGSLRVGFGQSLQIGGSVANAALGNVEVFDGELEVSGAFTNAGRFATHHSVLRFGGGLANTGQVLVGSGTADVFGSVQNLAGGQVIVSGTGNAIFYDDVVNSGEIRASAASSIVYFGALSGSGALTGEGMHFVEGTLGPGSSPGVMNAVNLTLGALSELEIEIFGIEPITEYDRLVVSGDLVLGGTLSVLLGGGFSPLAGTSFDILDWGTLAGAFHTLELPDLGPLLAWNTSLLYEDGSISVAAIPEPQTYALLLAGLGLLGFAARRRRQMGSVPISAVSAF